MIELKYSCPEDLDSMKEAGCGVYCDACKREVYDFTGKSLQEIVEISEANPSIKCGIFDEEVVQPSAKSWVQNVFRIAFAAVFVLGFNVSVLFAGDGSPDHELTKIEHTQQTSPIVTGTILDKKGRPLVAKIRAFLGGREVSGETNDKGEFKMTLPEGVVNSNIYFYVSAEDMQTEYVHISNVLSMSYNYKITLNKAKKQRHKRRYHRKYAGFYKANYSWMDSDKKEKKAKGKF